MRTPTWRPTGPAMRTCSAGCPTARWPRPGRVRGRPHPRRHHPCGHRRSADGRPPSPGDGGLATRRDQADSPDGPTRTTRADPGGRNDDGTACHRRAEHRRGAGGGLARSPGPLAGRGAGRRRRGWADVAASPRTARPARAVVASLPYWDISNGTHGPGPPEGCHRGLAVDLRACCQRADRHAVQPGPGGRDQRRHRPAAGGGPAVVPTIANITDGNWSYPPVARMLHHPACWQPGRGHRGAGAGATVTPGSTSTTRTCVPATGSVHRVHHRSGPRAARPRQDAVGRGVRQDHQRGHRRATWPRTTRPSAGSPTRCG